MSGDAIAHGLWFLLALTLVGSALLARQLKMAQMAKMAMAWIAIFALVFLAVYLWQSWSNADSSPEQQRNEPPIESDYTIT